MKGDFETIITERVIVAIKMLKNLKKAHSNLEICTKCNVNPNYISDVFKHKHNVSLQFTEMLIDKYCISRKYIYEGDGSVFATPTTTEQSAQMAHPAIQSVQPAAVSNEESAAEIAALKSKVAALEAQVAALIQTNATLVRIIGQKGDGMAAYMLTDAENR